VRLCGRWGDACLAKAGINFIGSQGIFLLLLKILKNTNNGSRVGDGDFHFGWILISQGFLSVDNNIFPGESVESFFYGRRVVISI
jgi:hypothetical protein